MFCPIYNFVNLNLNSNWQTNALLRIDFKIFEYFLIVTLITYFNQDALGNDTSMAALYLLSRQCTRRNVAYLALNVPITQIDYGY
jgi:hypothetical protein